MSVHDEKGDVFLHVAWAPFWAVDDARSVTHGTTLQALTQAHSEFVEDTADHEFEDVDRGGSMQVASGAYRECGFGALPGRGRASVQAGGKASLLPFSRNEHASRRLESAFQSISEAAAALTSVAFPGMLELEVSAVNSESPTLGSVLQYPRNRGSTGAGYWPTHQVAHRGAGIDVSAGETERWQHITGVSDLHVDAMDGTDLGNANIYACFPQQDPRVSPDAGDVHVHVLEGNDVCVFPSRRGGRGVQVRTMIPGWICVMIFETRLCLHGTACPADVMSFVECRRQIAGRIGVRCIPYPLRPLINLLSRAKDSTSVARDILMAARARQDSFLVERLLEHFPQLR